ncbi:MAG: flagellar biosynthetic protein FliO [Thermomicrobiales bacterium]
MNQPKTESSLVERARGTIENARQRPLMTALILTGMLAALLLAYTMATPSSSSNGSDDSRSSADQQSEADGDSGFLAEGYAELEGDDSSDTGTNWWGDVPGLMLRLLIVLGLAYGSLRLLNYFTRSGRIGGPQGRAMEVVDHLNLGQNRSIYLVRVSGRVLVVGATGNQLNLLSRMAAEELPEDVRTRAPNFTSQLHSRILRQINSSPVDDDEQELEKRRQALRELRDEEQAVPS